MYPTGILGASTGAGAGAAGASALGAGAGAGGALAATGFMLAGFLWAALILLAVGSVLLGLAFWREVALRRRLAAKLVDTSIAA